MNNITLTGRITSDCELRTTGNGVFVTSFTLAVRRPRVKDKTDFINCQAWRQNAEFLCNYARKGNLIGIAGVLTQRNYEDKNGNKRTAYEVICDNVEILESKGNAEKEDDAPNYAEYNTAALEPLDNDDDLPF